MLCVTTKARIAITTATIQFMHLILVWVCKQSYNYFVTFNSKLPLIHYTSCNFTFILVKHVHTLVKLCVVKQKVRLLTILNFFSILVSDSSWLQPFHNPKNFLWVLCSHSGSSSIDYHYDIIQIGNYSHDIVCQSILSLILLLL